MQTSNSGDTTESNSKREAQKKLVTELKSEWKLMWSERFDDRTKAEGVSIADYTSLHVEQGTIIHATKDFKALNFKEILEQHLVENPDRYIEPSNSVGGWNKFIKTKITSGNSAKLQRQRGDQYVPEKPMKQQPKKGGRGWLHTE
jgi:hypothetical protein